MKRLRFKAARLLAILQDQPNRVFSEESLLDALYGPNFSGSAKSISVMVLAIRKSLPLEEAKQLVAVRGQGYKWTGEKREGFSPIEYGPFKLVDYRVLELDGRQIFLREREYGILSHLCLAQGSPVTTQCLSKKVFGHSDQFASLSMGKRDLIRTVGDEYAGWFHSRPNKGYWLEDPLQEQV